MELTNTEVEQQDHRWEQFGETEAMLRMGREPGRFTSTVITGALSDSIGQVLAEAEFEGGVRRWSTAVIGSQEIIQLQSAPESTADAVCLSAHREHYVEDLASLEAIPELALPTPGDNDGSTPGPITGNGQVVVASRDRLNVYTVEIGPETTTLRHHEGADAAELPAQATSALLSRLGLEPTGPSDPAISGAQSLQELSSQVADSDSTLLAISWDRGDDHQGGAIVRSTNSVQTYVLSGQGTAQPNSIIDCQIEATPDGHLVDPGVLWTEWMSPFTELSQQQSE